MHGFSQRFEPGTIRNAIMSVLGSVAGNALSLNEIKSRVSAILGDVPSSSIRSYLRLNTPGVFERTKRGFYRLAAVDRAKRVETPRPEPFCSGKAKLYEVDCLQLLDALGPDSVEAVVTDPPYGLVEFSDVQISKLRGRRGGVWRIPPSFDGVVRSPLPRFTVLKPDDLIVLEQFFALFGSALLRVLVPGANVIIASNALLAHHVALSMVRAGFEARGTIARLVMTMRGGDRPKNAHKEFLDVSVMPRSMWEPWIILRRPLQGRVQDNLRKWGTGGFRRVSQSQPFGDVIESRPTSKRERSIANHPALKPQAFLRQIVRAALPLGKGRILDPFAGSGSTLAACNAVGYDSVGAEKDPEFAALARTAIPRLSTLELINPVLSKSQNTSSTKSRSSRS